MLTLPTPSNRRSGASVPTMNRNVSVVFYRHISDSIFCDVCAFIQTVNTCKAPTALYNCAANSIILLLCFTVACPPQNGHLNTIPWSVHCLCASRSPNNAFRSSSVIYFPPLFFCTLSILAIGSGPHLIDAIECICHGFYQNLDIHININDSAIK